MTAMPYAQVLFAGPDLLDGSFAELFRARLVELRGEPALAEIVDTGAGYDGLWQRVKEGSGRLLVIDLEAQSSSQHLDWLRSELASLTDPARVSVTSLFGQLDADAAGLHQEAIGIVGQPRRDVAPDVVALALVDEDAAAVDELLAQFVGHDVLPSFCCVTWLDCPRTTSISAPASAGSASARQATWPSGRTSTSRRS